MPQTLTTCTFCGTGCGLYLATENNRLIGAYPSKTHPSNAGKLCVRGWNICEVATAPERLQSPLIRHKGTLVPASWDEACAYVAQRLTDIAQRHGPDALAFFGSPRCSNEESYLLQKMARQVFGTNNIDHGAGVYRHNSINVLTRMLGTPASTCAIADLEHTRLILLDGVDLARQIPTIGGVVLRAKLAGATLVIVGTRRQRLAENADIFLQVYPGTETFLYGAMAKVLMDWGLMNRSFMEERCTQIDPFLKNIQSFDLLTAAQVCGVPAADIERAALAFGRAPHAVIAYSTSADSRVESATEAMVNLALCAGHMGRPGAGIMTLSEQANSQGVCDMGLLPNRFPGYMPVDDESCALRLEKLWGMGGTADGPASGGSWTPPRQLSRRKGMGASAALIHHDESKLKALWLCRYDPINSAYYGNPAAALSQCEFIVVQHTFMTDTAGYADVILPMAAFAEEQTSFTSTDRRIQIAEQALRSDGAPFRKPGWMAIRDVARSLGAGWSYLDAAAVMDEITQAIPFYAGARYPELQRGYGLQWPVTREHPDGTPVLFERADQKFAFAPVERPPLPTPHKDFPLTLVFGQSLYYWTHNVMVQHSETLKREYNVLMLDYPDGFVDINVEDAQAIGIKDGWKVLIHSESSCVSVTARVTDEVRRGVVIAPYFVKPVREALFSRTERGERLVPVRIEEDTSHA
jgi:predicted molibdopterin-dependent oxidoreductase YjgC